ncbi:hypothetical protein [Aestuariivirga sp.]|jgi:hypothetical protein|uniref:hypothetical protein n=1 Tax=Aestuariivirga sp. TaxID=2650926 RepID=UPI00378379C4
MGMPQVTSEQLVAAMGLAATGVSRVMTGGPLGRIGLTVRPVSSVSAEPHVCCNRAFRRIIHHEGN